MKNTIFGRNIVGMLDRDIIKNLAANVGFDLCGVAECRKFESEKEFLKDWISCGYSSSLDYLQRNIDKRFDVTQLVEGARSVVVCAVNYKNKISTGYPSDFRTKVASYACNPDYHSTIKGMLRRLCTSLKNIYPDISGRIFVDSAPILEKRYAVESGLGWIGKQSLLITPQFGSFVLLGEIVLCNDVNCYDIPLETSGCGNCKRCIESCPNGAIKERHIDTSKCISCATVEHANGISNLHGWIFGCDECQSCCPHNKLSPMHSCTNFNPVFNPMSMNGNDWLSLTEDEFDNLFASTPMSRSGLNRIKDNVLSNIDKS